MGRNHTNRIPGSLERDFLAFRDHGDAAALGRVFDATCLELMRIATHLSSDRNGAEDLVQETFLAAMRQKGRYDSRRRLMPWLLGILANRARRAGRASARQVDRSRRREPSFRDPARTVEQKELAVAVWSAVAKVPACYRPVLELHLGHGLSAREIAEALDVRRGTVRSQLSRGMRMLRRLLPPEFAAMLSCVLLVAGRASPARLRWQARPRAPAPDAGSLVSAAPRLARLGPRRWASYSFLLGTCALLLTVLATSTERRASAEPDGAPVVPAAVRRDLLRVADGAELVRRPAVAALRDAAGLTIRVTEPDGSAAAGALVLVTPATAEGLLRARWRRADARGLVVCTALAPGDYAVIGLTGGRRSVALNGGDAEVELRIPAGVEVRGRVVDPDGHAVPRARIQVAVGDRARYLAADAAESDATGRFVLRNVEPGRTVSALSKGRVPSWPETVWDSAEALDLTLRCGGPSGELEGRVLDADGLPLPGARVIVGARACPEGSGYGDLPMLAKWTDDDGRFRCAEAPTGRVPLWVGAVDHAPRGQIVDVVAGRSLTIEVALDRGGTLRGVARDGDGTPLSGVDIGARYELRDPLLTLGPPWAYPAARTDDRGRYLLPHVPQEPLSWAARLGRRSVLGPPLHVNESDPLRWDPVLPSLAECEGRLVDADGRPLTGFELSFRRPGDDQDVAAAVTDAGGAFRTTLCRGVPYELWARETDSALESPVLLCDDLVAGHRVIEIPATLRASAHLAGRVLDPGGRPAVGVAITVLRRAGSLLDFLCVCRAGPDGRFRVGPLPPGPIAVAIGMPSTGELLLDDVALTAEETLDLGDVPLAAPVKLTLRARGPGASEVRYATISRGDGAYTTAALHGGVGTSVLQPGSFDVSLWGSGVALNHAFVEAGAGQDVDVAISTVRGLQTTIRYPPIGRRAARLTFEWIREDGTLCYRQTQRWPPEGTDCHVEVVQTRCLVPGRYLVRVTDERGESRESRVAIDGVVPADVAVPR